MNRPIKVFIVEDHQMLIEGICSILSLHTEKVIVVGSATNCVIAKNLLESVSPDVVLMDIKIEDELSGITLTGELLQKFPLLKIIMLTSFFDSSTVREALLKGAKGYILKNSGVEELLLAIKTVMQGGMYIGQGVEFFLNVEADKVSEKTTKSLITRREMDVLHLIADGKTTQDIANQLFISTNTVETHIKNMLSKCGVKNRMELINYVRKNNLL